MNLKPLSPTQSLNKAYRKEKVNRAVIEQFKTNLNTLLLETNEKESEEYAKGEVTKFLNDTYYNGKYKINTKGRIDLAIYEGDKPVVIIEAKRPKKQDGDMLKVDNLNAKAMHELMLYYLRERIEHNNTDIHYLIATNTYEWFVFDASVFEKLFYNNKALVEEYNNWNIGRKAAKETDFFYNSIAKPFLTKLKEEISFTWFDLREESEKALKKEAEAKDQSLVPLYKIFSPAHLLKLPFANDSNTLDTGFYNELLHIIGLEEEPKGGKKLIGRKPEAKRNPASLLENTIEDITTKERLRKVNNLHLYGATEDEQLFNVALELCITWVNRILFLKLLEGQLVNYHKGNAAYRFLDSKLIPDYNELDKLFFKVLAQPLDKRSAALKQKYVNVPYLNSSLFDTTVLEEETSAFISVLDDGLELPLHKSTVLKDVKGKKTEGDLTTLGYLFRFLDAYDFSSEGGEQVQEDNKALINASVLGLIFEKINGYKDGSFFTPGFITMYMCRETIRRAVVQKFNEAKGWDCESFDQLYNYIKPKDIKEANSIINSLKLCDPAVGSGHFLVSALNEIIAIKSELGILCDREGQIIRDKVEVVNDELFVSIDHEKFFEYIPGNKESQRVQEALFHEKEYIMENCLFGVDINPNSVKICNLRLWIELLKHSYYKEKEYTELETLPNIDINIKCGNSLISRFGLDADLGKALKSIKYGIKQYREFVNLYKNATSKEEKRGYEKLINQIKGDFRTEIAKYSDPRVVKLQKLSAELFLYTQKGLFKEPEEEYGKNAGKKKEKIAALEAEIEKLSKELDDTKNNVLFQNAFEWRFEFPEVLDDEGKFKGFDLVIGNPPYIRQESLGNIKEYLKRYYTLFTGTGDIFSYFYELSFRILKSKGTFCFINNTFDKTNAGLILRKFIQENNTINSYIDFTSVVVFQEATTYPIILLATKEQKDSNSFSYLKVTPQIFSEKEYLFNPSLFQKISQRNLNNEAWNFIDSEESSLRNKILKHKKIIDIFGKSYRGIVTGFNEAFIISNDIKKKIIQESPKDARVIKPFLEGKDIKKWNTPKIDKWIIFTRRGVNIDEYPAIKKHLSKYRNDLTPKKKSEQQQGRKPGSYLWYEIQDSVDYYDLFEKPKITWPNLQNKNRFSLDDKGRYINAPSVILPSSDNYLLAILNSSITWYFLKSICVVRNGGFIEVKPQYFEQIPIPYLTEKNKNRLTELVDQLLENKKADPEADTSKLEKQIDQLVYKLYELTPEEIEIVEGK